MSRILELAEAVAAALADYSAEVLFIPEFDLKGTKETRASWSRPGRSSARCRGASTTRGRASTWAC